VGVTETTPIIGVVPALVAVNEGITLPEPVAANPMAASLFLHANVEPAIELVKVTLVVGAALQTVCVDIADKVATGVPLNVGTLAKTVTVCVPTTLNE